MSLQCCCNVVTLQRRCNDISATLCVYWVNTSSHIATHLFLKISRTSLRAIVEHFKNLKGSLSVLKDSGKRSIKEP